MQVKKFEAKSMREALEMVKFHLGPEAIILSARDNSRGFGLAGEKSVEVTAAVSEETLRKKLLAEKKMNDKTKSQYKQSSARVQKSFIEKASLVYSPPTKRPLTSTPYIEIGEGGKEIIAPNSNSMPSQVAEQRIRSAVESAVFAGQATMEAPHVRPKKGNPSTVNRQIDRRETSEIGILRQEIQYLKGILDKFQKLPQSFVQLHPGAEEGLPYEMSSTFEKLSQAGISRENAIQLLKDCMQRMDPENLKKGAFVDAWVAKELLDQIFIKEKNQRERYQVFVGPSGGGKTSSLVKLASHKVISEKKKVAILTTDYGKVGAAEQLRIYAQILNVPFAVVKRPRDWEVIQSKLSMVDDFLVDFPGMNLRSMGELQFLRDLLPPPEWGRCVHFVQSILAKDVSVFELAQRYMPVGLQDVIFTCLDESVQHGLIYNFQKKFQLPLHSFGIGPKIPEDWELATKERVVDLIFKLTKIRRS